MEAGLPPIAALPPHERDALTVLAACTRPVSRSEWESRIRTANLRVDAARGLYGAAFKAVVERLRAAGAIETPPDSRTLYHVPDGLVAPTFADAASRGRLEAIVRPLLPTRALGWFDSHWLLRPALALGDEQILAEALRPLLWKDAQRTHRSTLVAALTRHAPTEWIARLPHPLRDEYLCEALHEALFSLLRVGDSVVEAAIRSENPEVRGRAALAKAFSGDPAGAHGAIAEEASSPWELGARGVIFFTESRWAEARAAFDGALMTKTGTRRARGLPSFLGVFELLLAASPAARGSDATKLPSYVQTAQASMLPWPGAIFGLMQLARFRATGRVELHLNDLVRGATWLEHLVCGLAARWIPDQRNHARDLAALAPSAEQAGLRWIANELRAVADERPASGSLASLRSDRATWQVALEALESAVEVPTSSEPARTDVGEIHWVIEHLDAAYDEVQLTARLAKRRAGLGSFISARRIAQDASLPMTPQDRALAAAVATTRPVNALPTLRTLLAAVDHPRIHDARGNPLEVVRGSPEIHVRSTATGAKLEVFPSFYSRSGIFASLEPGRLVVYERTETAARVATVLGSTGLDLPKEGLARVSDTLSRLAPHLVVRGADALGNAVGARSAPADGTIRVQLFRAGSAFRARLRVVPGGVHGPALRPGAEPRTVLISEAEGAVTRVRDLERERSALQCLLSACPLLTALRADGDDLVADDIETCLELLLELEPLRAQGILVEWPAGDPLRPPIVRPAHSLSVRVKASDKQWLEVETDLALDEQRVLAFDELLSRVSAGRSRFVPIGDGEFLALTDELRERIDALSRVRALGDRHGRAPLAMLPAIAQWADGANVTMDPALDERLTNLARCLEATPRVPRTLRAELREYQREGFVFLARRAAAGLGSCLADDMGLGKTVQALALLLARANEGPALVVAPTSVCRNWEDEARKFAPSLAIHRLGSAADRPALVARLAAGDVLLASYGLLSTCSDSLASRRFATVVFDEAHALKNQETRRAAAARSVLGDALVALTGTPLENHLGELHSLFDVLSPGLLGTHDRFARAFSTPIAGGDKRATAQLRALVRPFLLRRTKSQVLDELPAKIEVTRVISPGEDERAFYEALRRRAVARVERASGPRARFQILAEITKLRRAAIDPRLVAPEDAPSGAKLEALAELVAELRDEGHRALVFSQFLEVLDRAEARLAADGVRCVRLDGTMDTAARAAAVDAFQNGQADVFLLSLRAGGLGMNLTAADYVIHVDPWWNPAVEDQATDRAHRIGQSRPVTVLRLVTEGTIEERVLRLHASKRALYDSALGELGSAQKLEIADLVELVRLGADASPPTRPSPERGSAAPPEPHDAHGPRPRPTEPSTERGSAAPVPARSRVARDHGA